MIHIDPASVANAISPQWLIKAQQTADSVAAIDDLDEKRKAIAKHESVWRELKTDLSAVMYEKCWYCESKQIRSDNPVDHFRPKSAVKECLSHPGYWWLAFDPTNYRFCCCYCNSKHRTYDDSSHGKGTNFPLWEEDKRACNPTDNLDDEKPLLLDPMKAADPPLLWFDDTGEPAANPRRCTGAYVKKRVEESIKLYHLDEQRICELRLAIAEELKRIVKFTERLWNKFVEGDTTAEDAVSEQIHQLRGFIKADAEYSASARAVLMGLRNEYVVAELVFEG